MFNAFLLSFWLFLTTGKGEVSVLLLFVWGRGVLCFYQCSCWIVGHYEGVIVQGVGVTWSVWMQLHHCKMMIFYSM